MPAPPTMPPTTMLVADLTGDGIADIVTANRKGNDVSVLIGNGDGSDGHACGACMVHNPGYDFHDANIPVGAAYWVLLAERFLATKETGADH